MALELPAIEAAAEEGEREPPLLLAHGLFGQARNFQTMARKLATTRRVLAVDMRNHGDAPHDRAMDYPAMAGDLARTVRERLGGRARVLGHSMGGKAAMALALAEPELVDALIVADIAPVAYRHGEGHAEIVAAMQRVALDRVARRSDADPMLADAVPEPALRAFLLQSLAVEGGRARWKLNLQAIAAAMETLTGFPETEASYRGRALFLHGGKSDYVRPEHAEAIRARFPAAEIEPLEGAGHWLHAEAPEPFRAAVERWLGGL